MLRKGFRILVRRLRETGLRTTLLWIYGRGLPKLTGIPLLGFSMVTPQLFVGPQYRARGKAHLEKNEIHYDVNMRIEFDDAKHGLALANYCYLPTIDDEDPSFEHLDQGAAFIRDAVETGGKVYIHCAGGIGRAPTMAAAYLMHTGMTLAEAITAILRVRPFIRIMPPQMVCLQEYEKRIQVKENG
jgi:protein-tyrosine phosphatase